MSSLAELIDALTTGSQDTPDADQTTQLKRQCRDGGAAAVQQAFDHLMRRLSVPRAHVRLLSMHLLDVLFQRSHGFRQLATARLEDILGLALGAYGQRRARPAEQAERLRGVAGRMVLGWARRFSGAYPRLAYGAWHVRHAEGIRASRRRGRVEGTDAGRRECAWRMVDSVRMEMLVWGARMLAATRVAERSVGVAEDADDLFADPGDDGASEASVDADEVLAVVAGNRQHVAVEVSAEEMLGPRETADNAAAYDGVREALRECRAYGRRAGRWVAWLERAAQVDGVDAGGMLDEARMWVGRLDAAVALGGRVGVDALALGRRRTAAAAAEGSDSEDEAFEDVDAAASMRLRLGRRPPVAQPAERNAVFALLHEAEGLAGDPTYVDPRELLALRRRHAPAPRPLPPLTAVERELLATAPVVAFDTDLLHWSKQALPLDGVEVRHRFLGAARDAPVVRGGAMERLCMRAVRYESLGGAGAAAAGESAAGEGVAAAGGGFLVEESAGSAAAPEAPPPEAPPPAATPPAAAKRQKRGRKRPGSAIQRLQAAMRRRRQ